jgi:hypothetical protein
MVVIRNSSVPSMPMAIFLARFFKYATMMNCSTVYRGHELLLSRRVVRTGKFYNGGPIVNYVNVKEGEEILILGGGGGGAVLVLKPIHGFNYYLAM